MIQKLYIIIRDFQRQMNRKNISSFAASTAFFLFLSLVPMLIMICTIIPFTPLTEENLLNGITEFTPDMLDPLMISIISDVYDKSAGVLSVAAFATLWSAGKGVLALIRGLNEINEVEEKRNYFLLRSIASFYTLIMLVILLLSLGLNVFGNVLLDMILAKLPKTRLLFDFFMHFRFLAVWLILTILFTALYTYIPNKKLKFRLQIPGAVFSAVVWSIFSWGFSIYVEATDSFSTYGSLSMIIIIMLWLYFCIYIIMIGAQINRYFGPAYRLLYK
ncbi:MAG: YihY/virulence factor BrkB family protein, partial [Lachnospiraceae bacterium]